MFTQSDVEIAVMLIQYGMLTINDIPEGAFKTAVQSALTAQ